MKEDEIVTCILTSNPFLDDGLNPANGFIGELRNCLKSGARALDIASSPDDPETNDFYGRIMYEQFKTAGFEFASFTSLDRRNAAEAETLVQNADFIILAGGHVPTQNAFFHDIKLGAILQSYQGVLMGISAGTMNSAETVYAQPELDGEATSLTYLRFLKGLGLTEKMVLPHYQAIKDEVLDGLRVFEDITYPDSVGRKFYALIDGSYILCKDGHETLYGEAYLIENGMMKQLCRKDNQIILK